VFEKVRSYFNVGSTIYGVELYTSGEDVVYHVTIVRKEKNELLISEEKRFSDWESLLEFMDVKVPICLTINTNEILERAMKVSNGASLEALLDKAFPSLDFTRFYFNVTPFKKDVYLAINEKKVAHEILQKFKEAGFHILQFYLGLSPLSFSVPYINTDTVQTTHKILSFSSGLDASQPTDFNISQSDGMENGQTHSINGLPVSNGAMLGFSSVLPMFFEGSTIQTNYESDTLQFKSDFKYYRYFQVLLWPLIAGILAILLVNFLMFNFYFGEVQELGQESNVRNAQKERLLDLENEVSLKQRKVTAIISNKNSSTTYIVDNIAKGIPESVLLDELNYQPLLRPMRDGKPLEQDLGTILLKGEAAQAEEFSEWIENMEGYPWIQSVETQEYGYKSKTSSNFILKIRVNGEE